MHAQSISAHPYATEIDSFGSFRSWVTVTGVVLVALGTVAIVYDYSATVASVTLFGGLLLFAGLTQIVQAFQVRTWSGFFLYLLDGIIRSTIGTLLMVYPVSGAQAITLVLSAFFIVGGTFKAIAAAVVRFPTWGWTVASGVVSIVLGVMLAMQWPASGLWFIGLAVGIDLILYGWTLLMFAAAIKRLSPAIA